MIKLSKFMVIAAFITLISCHSSDSKSAALHTYPITVADIIEQDTPIYIESIGNVYSLQVVDIRPQVTGILTEAIMEPGQKVKKGEILFTIDSRPYQASLDEAKGNLEKDQANLKLAEITVKRYEALVEKDYVSKLNFDQYSTNVELSKAQILIDQARVDQAQINLNYCTIRSPIDGRAGDITVDPGNLVVSNSVTSLTTLRQISPADIHFSIAQRDFYELQKSDKSAPFEFEMILPQDPTKTRTGTIYFLDNTLNTTNGTILIRGTIPNEDEIIWPGEFVRIKLKINTINNALLAPAESVKIGQSGHYVYIYKPESSTVEYRPVEIGEKIDGKVIIKSGVKKNEKVVTQGQLNLRDGASVVIKSKSEN